MRRRMTVALGLGASVVVLIVLARNAVPLAAQGSQTPARSAETAYPVFLPLALRNWFSVGPHFALGYGPYRAGQAPGGAQPATAQMAEDLALMRPETNLIRLYNACGVWATAAAQAEQQGFHIYQGAALTGNLAGNQSELDCFAASVAAHDNVLGGIVGNEVLLRGDLSESALIGYIQQAQAVSSAPVGTAETWDTWCNLSAPAPRCPGRPGLGAAVEWVVAHVHPYWEGTPVEHGAAQVVTAYLALRAAYPGKPVTVGETGWPTCGDTVGAAVPGLANQERFIEDLWHWTKEFDLPIVYFEAFDEPWKTADEGAAGACWGLTNVSRAAKHNDLDWTAPTRPAPGATPAVYIEHPVGNATTTTNSSCAIPVFGRVDHAGPGWHVKVEVLTNQWYVQDKWYVDGLAPITDGLWGMPEVVLGGQGAFNNHSIRATLLDGHGSTQASVVVTDVVRGNACVP